MEASNHIYLERMLMLMVVVVVVKCGNRDEHSSYTHPQNWSGKGDPQNASVGKVDSGLGRFGEVVEIQELQPPVVEPARPVLARVLPQLTRVDVKVVLEVVILPVHALHMRTAS